MRRLYLAIMAILLCAAVLPARAQEEFELVEIIGRGRVDDAIWLPDGRLAVGGARGIWLYDDIQAEPSLIETSWIRSMALAGNVLATGHYDASVTLWDAASLTEIDHFEALDWSVKGLSFSADGKRLAVGGGSGIAQVWDVETNKMIFQPEMSQNSQIDDVAISPDGQWLYVLSLWVSGDAVGGSQLDIWEIDQPQNTRTLEQIGQYVGHIGVSPDGLWLALPSAEGLFIWDTQKEALIHTEVSTISTSLPLFSGSQLFVYTEWSFSRVEVGSWLEDEPVFFDEAFPADDIDYADPWFALVSDYTFIGSTLRLWQADGETLDFPYENSVSGIHFEGDQVVVEHREGSISNYDGEPATGSELSWYPLDPPEYGFVSASNLVFLDSGEVMELPYWITYAEYSPDRRVILLGTDEGDIHFLEVATHTELGVWDQGDVYVTYLTFDPAGDRLLVGSIDGLVRVYRYDRGF